jgi:hypothetical protein
MSENPVTEQSENEAPNADDTQNTDPTLPNDLSTLLDEIHKIHTVLQVEQPKPIPELLKDKRQWKIRPWRFAFVLVFKIILPSISIYLFTQAIVEDSFPSLWWSLGFFAASLISWILEMSLGFFAEVRNAPFRMQKTISDNSDQESEKLRQILTCDRKAIEHVADQYASTIAGLEGRFAILFGGIKQVGIFASLVASIGGFVGIAENLDFLKQPSLVAFSGALSMVVVVMLIQEQLEGLQYRHEILKRAAKLLSGGPN